MNRENLLKLVTYNITTGAMCSIKTGKVFSCVNSSGYIVANLNKKQYTVHRLAFLYMTGSVPDYVDHIDGNRLNNSWFNLRPCTVSENGCNRGVQKNSKTGVKNVYPHADGGYFVQIRVRGKIHHLGTYKTIEEAKEIAAEARIELHGDFASKEERDQ